MKKLLSFLLLASVALGANVQVRDLSTTTVLPAANDYHLVDGSTNGTTKSLALNVTRQVDSRAALAALSVTNAADHNVVWVLGATVPGDGGASMYYYLSTSTATPDGVNVIQPTVGSGRWLIAKSFAVPAPTVSTLGGVFSKAAVAHQFLTSVGTDGSIGQAGVAASDITGLGSMSLQTSNSVAITGGSIVGITPLAVTDGGTGASTAAGAITNLGLGTLALQNTTELKVNYGIFTSPISVFDSSTGGLYLGYGSGTAIIRSVADNSGSYAPISFYLGSNVPAYFDSTGLVMQGTYKAQQPAAPTAGIDLCNKTYVDSVAGGGGSGGRINVKTYGATGNGTTNDTTAINAAIAAMTNGSTLYFPAGKYLITAGSLTNLTSLSNITILGDGRSSALYSTATSPASAPFFVVANSCAKVTIRDFAILGSASVRTSGNHGLCIYSPNTLISGMYITGTGDFGIYVGSGGSLYNKNVQVVDCITDHTLGDGFHFGPVTDSGLYSCIAYYTGDDGVGLGDDGGIGYPATRIEVVGFQSMQAGNPAGGGTHGAGIRIFDGATDIHVTGGSIYQSCEAGITSGRFYTTSTYNTRIKVDGLRAYQCLQQAGMYANFNFQFCNGLSVTGCWSEAPVSLDCYAFLDCSNVSFIGNTGKDAVLRTVATDDGSTTNVASTWNNWVVANNVSLGAPSNESFYFVPATGKTINNLVITGNTDNGGTAATYIFTNRLGGVCKIGNNISANGKAIANGGTGTTPTTFNNN